MNMTIAERVKSLRKQEGLTQEQLAQALFVSDATISHIENGLRLPSKALAMKLAERYGKSTDYFLVENLEVGNENVTFSKKKKLTTGEEEELIKIVMETVEEFLDENGLEMSIDGKAKIFAHLLRVACKEPTMIRGILSGMLLGNSSLFSKKSR